MCPVMDIYQLSINEGNSMVKTVQRFGQGARVAWRWRDGFSGEIQIKAKYPEGR